MKPKLRLLGAVWLLFAAGAGVQAASYTVTNLPGWNLIANQLDSPNGNNIKNVIPSPPIGSLVKRFNLTTKTFDSLEIFTAAGGWLPGTNVLNPGDGLYFSNTLAGNFNMVFNGNPHVPVLPLNIGNATVLVARQTNDIASVTNILGYNPPVFTVVYQFIPGSGHDPNVLAPPNYTIYALRPTGWAAPPGPPSAIKVGESVWIATNGTLPSITTQPKTQSACIGTPVNFTVAATGTPPLGYQWFLNGSAIGGATTTTFSIASASSANAGTYSVQVSNPFGTIPSTNAVLTVGDFQPPTLFCPTNVTAQCAGPQGTPVTFTVTAIDDCDAKPTVVCTPPSGSVFPLGTTQVSCTARDATGNSNTCTFPVTIQAGPPVLTCPSNLVAIATSANGVKVSYTVTVSSCYTNVALFCQPPPGSTFPIGTTTVTCRAIDQANNQTTCSFPVTVLPQGCCVGKVWSSLDVTEPPGRQGHAMVYDSARGRIVLFGGAGSQAFLGDTWEWNGTQWSLMSTSGPSPRAFMAMAYDRVIGKTVLFGGLDANGPKGDTWFWDGAAGSWTPVTPATSPGPRQGHAMAYDSARRKTVLFGGVGSSGTELADTWEFDGGQWAPGPVGSVTPPARQRHAMAYGSFQGQLLLFGGAKQGGVFGDTWKWDGTNWTLLTTNGPSPRAYHAMAYNDNCDSITLFGGGVSVGAGLGDTWEWNGTSWALTANNIPPGRVQHAMAHDSSHKQTILFSGSRGSQGLIVDTWAFGLSQTPPAVVSVYAPCGDSKILVAFSKALLPSSAQAISNYALVCGGVGIGITKAVLSDDPRLVCLFTAAPIGVGGSCFLFMNGIQDVCGNTMPFFQQPFECNSEPCSRGTAGAEYWLTFPGNYAPDPTNPPTVQVFVAGFAGTIGAVSMPGLPTPFSSSFTIPASGVATITLPREADLANANDVVQSNAVHVIASQKVSVYGLNHVRYTTDAYLGLSTKALGQTYLVMAYQNMFTNAPELNGSQFAIASSQDGTTVLIVPSAAVGSHPAGIPFSITMNQGQTYQLRNSNASPADLSGTIVVADQPIAVFGGHQCANIPNSNVFFCDYVVEQLTPTDLWGTSFVTVPLATRSQGDTFRIMALFNNTTVSTNGVALPTLVNQGKFVELRLASRSQITANRPILVAQYANSSDFDGVINSDPFMVLIPPTSMFSPNYVVQSPTTDFTANYINIMASAAAVGQINVDGFGIGAGAYSAIGASGYFAAQVFVGTGPHTLFSSNGAPFGIIVYGWNQYDSYGYPGGSCGAPQGQPPRFTCPPTNVTVQVGANCLASVPDLTTQVGGAGSALLITQSPLPGTLVGPGTYNITITVVDQFGQRQLCQSVLTVPVSTSAGMLCPNGVATNCTSPSGTVVFYSVSLCNSNFGLSCTPPPGSLFPPGTTTVTCVASNAAGLKEQCSFPVTVTCLSINVTRSNNSLTLTWPGTGTLQKGSNVTGPWITIPNARSPFTISISGSQGFFRVQVP